MGPGGQPGCRDWLPRGPPSRLLRRIFKVSTKAGQLKLLSGRDDANSRNTSVPSRRRSGESEVIILLDVGAWRIGIGRDVATFRVNASGEASMRVLNASVATGARPVRAVVEIVFQISGTRPHALLAGEYLPEGGGPLELEVRRGGPFDLQGPAAKGPLGLPVVVGLPDDLAEAAADGFSSVPDAVPSGRVKIHGGAIDVHSSPWVFQRCGAAIRLVLIAEAMNNNPAMSLSKLVANW
jgi:hypothetical protein